MTKKIFLKFIFIFLFSFGIFSSSTYADQKIDIMNLNPFFKEIEETIVDKSSSEIKLKEYQKNLLHIKKEIKVYEKINQNKILNLREELNILEIDDLNQDSLNQDIRNRKEQILSTLSTLEPNLLKVQAYLKRSEIINSEIEKILQKRIFERYFKIETSPLNFFMYLNSFDEFFLKLDKIPNEIFINYNSNVDVNIYEKLPLILFLTSIIILILFALYKRYFLKISLVFIEKNQRNFFTYNFLIYSARFAITFFVVYIIINLIKITNLFGYYGLNFLNSIFFVSLSILGGLWIKNNIREFTFFHKEKSLISKNNLNLFERYLTILSIFVGIYILFNSLFSSLSVSYSTQSILNYPLTVLNCFLLFKILSFIDFKKSNEKVNNQFVQSLSFTDIIIFLGKIISIASLLFGLIGYFYASQKLLYNSIFTFFVIAASFLFFNVLCDLNNRYVFFERKEIDKKTQNKSFLPIFFGFIIFLINLPIFALVWGADWTDISQVWNKLNDGVKIGSANLTLPNIISFLVIFTLGFMLTQLIKKALSQNILPKTNLDVGGQNAVITGVSYSGIIISSMIAISSTGLDLSSLAIVAGALSVGLGFGLQTIVSNFVSGIILLIERPVKDGDWIEVAGFSGTVRKISVRSTQIQTFDRGTVIVPNSELISGSVLNYTHSNVMGRVRVPIGVSYNSDVKKVEKILLEIAYNHDQVLRKPEPSIIFMGFGADSMNFEIRAFLKDVGYVLSIRSDMNFEIAKRFKEEGIEIPFPQRDVNIKNPEIFKKLKE